ncbi:class I SAM-dependent methyltransferase [Sphingomonas radiodurans]|uniref:class I SAM-dependent methyltransferase n=1 Tax=Sphingomonas radiodurans TaxID=2890321 RepID=UPI001E29FC40|nr:class I SAM-dependent methyltransferase [Sphingomonas radiodurans]WBH18018.1 class I SAM-dependent methyltransferase [Sphingomonas radiodurans]
MKHDVPPPYTAVTRHAVFPEASHDEAARFDFLANLNKYISGSIGAGNKRAYDTRVLPAFRAEHGRDPADRFEIRRAMNKDPWHLFWSALKRNSMEMRQQNGRQMALRQMDELDARVRQFNEGRETLDLDPAVTTPRYQAAVDIHCMPGSYHGEDRPGDVSAGANYDAGIFATTAGGLGALSDGGGQALVEWIRRERPGWTPRRILDLGCTVGHNIVPLALAFPDTEVIAIDTAAPSLRYGHARAQALGARNLRFVQMNAEDMSRFDDGHFDWVQTTMFLHELSGTALPRIIREGYRVLAPGGLMFHLEQPEYSDEMPLYEQFIRDWDAFNNNEPFWSAMHALDMKEQMIAAGFAPESLFTSGVRAVVDTDVFPEAKSGADEDHGRAAYWHAYGAWKAA